MGIAQVAAIALQQDLEGASVGAVDALNVIEGLMTEVLEKLDPDAGSYTRVAVAEGEPE
jgi:hypothetical protein